MNIKHGAIFFIVIFIVSTLTIPQFSPPLKLSKQKEALVYIEIINDVIFLVKDDVGAFPSTDIGWDAFYANVNDDNGWNGPYIKKKIGKDPWGNEIVYRYPHQCKSRQGSFALYSVGENGIDECMSGDDIYIEL